MRLRRLVPRLVFEETWGAGLAELLNENVGGNSKGRVHCRLAQANLKGTSWGAKYVMGLGL